MTNRIRIVRAERRLSQAVVARRARMSQTMVSAIENERREPSKGEQKRIAKALRAPVERVFQPEADERDDDEPRRKLTRNEQLQAAADAGYDTWEEYRGER